MNFPEEAMLGNRQRKVGGAERMGALADSIGSANAERLRLLAQLGGQVRPGADSMGEECSVDKEVGS